MDKNISEEAKEFIRQNKTELINKFASLESFPSSNNSFSIFMAGSPGAGKTEFSKALIKGSSEMKIVRIDPDEIRDIIPYYNGKNSYLFQGAVSIGLEKLYDHVLKNNQNVIVDGTLANFEASTRNIERSIKKGRTVGVFYLYQDPLVAWDFTKKREKLEGRRITKEVFVKSLFAAKENVNKIKKVFKNKIEVFLIEKNFENKVENIKFNIDKIDNHIKIKYSDKLLISKLC